MGLLSSLRRFKAAFAATSKPATEAAQLDAALAPEFDATFYRDIHADLAEFSDVQLRAHYEEYGRGEGRRASPLATRPPFTHALSGLAPALEIGPFTNPCLTGPNVRYLDVLDTEELKLRAEEHGMDPAGVPPIDYVSAPEILDVGGDRFPLVFSSHAVEHQPNLVGHLQEVESILTSGGAYGLVVPDCRYCFDHFNAPSEFDEVVLAHEEKRRFHSLASYVAHRTSTTHNDPARHWLGDHGEIVLDHAAVRRATDDWHANQGTYLDVHGWQFTPSSFRQIILDLNRLGLTRLTPLRIYDTPHNLFEFCVVLALSSDEPAA